MDVWRAAERLRLSELSHSRDPLRVLRVSVHFDELAQLEKSLEGLSAWLTERTPAVTLLRVNYPVHALSAEARALHHHFTRRHPEVSTYIPLCLPPSPLGAMSRWTTPENCGGCLFREGERCGGLGRPRGALIDEVDAEVEREPDPLVRSGGALCDMWDDHALIDSGVAKTLMSADPPLCYWWPQSEHLESITEALTRCQVSSLWDLGGGNGYLAWLISQTCHHQEVDLDEVLWIDPVASIYPDRHGVTKWPHTAEHALEHVQSGDLAPADALLISWPSPGRSFARLITALNPKLIIRATDAEGVCGVRHGHRALELYGDEAQWYDLSASFVEDEGELHRWDDLSPPPGYMLLDTHTAWTYRDLRAETEPTTPTGILRLFMQHTPREVAG